MTKEITKTSVRQPRELWNKVRNEAINRGITIDDVVKEILEQHYGVKPNEQ